MNRIPNPGAAASSRKDFHRPAPLITLEAKDVPSMKSIFDPVVAAEIQTRLAQLQPDSAKLWGKMTVSQTLAHCAISLQWALGEATPAQEALPVRLLGRLIKPLALRNDSPMRKNSPTSKDLLIDDPRDFDNERTRLSRLIDRFAGGGPAACTQNPHAFFGKLTPDEWAVLTYKHLDHHLRQFGA